MPKSFTFTFPLATDPDESPAGPAWAQLVVPPGIRDSDEDFDAFLERYDAAVVAADEACAADVDAALELVDDCRGLVRGLMGKPFGELV